MREVMGERGDFLFAQRIGDLRHRRPAATGSLSAGESDNFRVLAWETRK